MLYAGVRSCKCEDDLTPACKCEIYSYFYAGVGRSHTYIYFYASVR